MTTPYQERKIHDPALNPGDEPYFTAAADGKLLVKHCKACGELHHFPRALCPFCWSTDLTWKETSGQASIYTFSITRRGAGAPYCIAYVTLDEGPTLLTNIVDTDLDTIRIGDRVRVVFRTAEGGTVIPMFAPQNTGAPPLTT